MIKGWKAKCMALRAEVAELKKEIKFLRHISYLRNSKATKAIKLRGTYSCLPLQAIGDRVNLSRERVRQILKRDGLPTKAVPRPPQRFQCLNCEQSFTPRRRTPGAKQERYDHKSFCNLSCSAKYHLLTLICETCGVTFSRPQSYFMNNLRHGYGNHFFCSPVCFGKWAGKNHGFTAHPENCGRGIGGRKRKWDYGQVAVLREKTGWGCRRLSRALATPERTVSYILAKVKAGQQL